MEYSISATSFPQNDASIAVKQSKIDFGRIIEKNLEKFGTSPKHALNQACAISGKIKKEEDYV